MLCIHKIRHCQTHPLILTVSPPHCTDNDFSFFFLKNILGFSMRMVTWMDIHALQTTTTAWTPLTAARSFLYHQMLYCCSLRYNSSCTDYDSNGGQDSILVKPLLGMWTLHAQHEGERMDWLLTKVISSHFARGFKGVGGKNPFWHGP